MSNRRPTETHPMKLLLDGATITDLPSFTAQVASAISRDADAAPRYFGFDLHSLGDRLHGGFLGAPPYEVVVERNAGMILAMGHGGLAQYCRDMLAIIDAGGRGLVQEDSRSWHEQTRAAAPRAEGPTLLDLLMDVVQAAPASLTLLDDDGSVRPSAWAP